ncbi:hypothetical protein [Corynebacterium pygosceleis]|uniref:Uncharacterized protein n=1 Tax=Corynebacterium pygosceleis TaxID=2800406 RepID=A0A9Q4GKY1_9CORY|nr:hypothetical protein [Corynebacterium pygosceleis]MCK7637951.1 hypothetical protein [Corynebacterium pygosceleis]MCK7675666.1 hypothetical protein [Corynebacterium pygosceleis]MCX7468667.1 hypothetical protein [Corynebacterium pygosceleis]
MGDKFDEHAGVGFLTDGRAVVASDGLDGISDQIGYSQRIKDTRLPCNEKITEFGDGSLYIVDRPQDSSGKNFFVGVVRLSPTSTTSQQDSGISQVHMDYVAPVRDDTTDTSAPTETTVHEYDPGSRRELRIGVCAAPLGIGALPALFAVIIHFLTTDADFRSAPLDRKGTIEDVVPAGTTGRYHGVTFFPVGPPLFLWS